MTMQDVENMQALMNQGFLIYQENNAWTIHKIAVPNDPRTHLPIKGTNDETFTTLKNLPSQDNAIMQGMLWLSGADLDDYTVEVKYDLGFGPKFKSLGTLEQVTVEDAEKKAFKIAEAHFKNNPKIKWCSRIRPASLPEG